MKFINGLNNRNKILLLILYIVLLSGILLLITSQKTSATIGDGFGELGNENSANIPGDENMDIAIRIKERRTFPTEKNEKETQYWDLQVYLHLKDQNAIYRNVTVYTSILKKDGTYKYEEKTAEILTGIENSTPGGISDSTSDRGFFSSYSTTSKTMVYNSSTNEYTKKDGTPDKIFVKVVYDVFKDDEKVEKKSFSYKCDIINADELDFNQFDSTTTNDSNNIILKDIDEILKLKVRTELEEDKVKTDTYRLNVTYNPLKNDEKVIESASFAVFLGIKNTESDVDNYFADYIDFAQYHGSLPYLYTIPQVATAYNGSFEMDNLYVYANIKNVNGTTNEAKVFIPINSLPKY